MINFLHPNLLPKIIGKPLSTENYEAENLISDLYTNKLRGFIAFPSTKPPIELEFELLCTANIWYILLNTSVGNQRCSGVEIFAKNNTTQYVSIGRAIYDAQGLIFCNNRRYSTSVPPPSYNANVALHFFKSGSYKSFLNATTIKIVIFRTEKSVPCLASVEVWGLPAKSCSQKTMETVQKLSNPPDRNDECCSDKKPSRENEGFKIPDEFRDDLTYELMTIPYTLPSGKSIDHTTLEKHIASEKSFGRKPGDPFTGNKFTQGLKPVLNVGLKSRIDMFLLKNSHKPQTFHLKRTLRLENKVQKRPKKDDETSDASCSINDLDFLIQKAKSVPNFVSFTEPTTDPVLDICILCKCKFEYLYELPCEHRFCRQCLLGICTNCLCTECKKCFVKCDVKKIHV